jgi:hypothetical protein
VNGDWGLGKSFMINRWSQDLERAGHPVVMFNSWENDFTSEPLVAFIAELNSSLSSHFDMLPKAEEFRRKWLTTAKAVLVPTLKVVGMAALKHGAGIGLSEFKTLIGTEDEDESSEVDKKGLSEQLTKVVEEELKSHTNVKSAIADFNSRFLYSSTSLTGAGRTTPLNCLKELSTCSEYQGYTSSLRPIYLSWRIQFVQSTVSNSVPSGI